MSSGIFFYISFLYLQEVTRGQLKLIMTRQVTFDRRATVAHPPQMGLQEQHKQELALPDPNRV